MSKNWMKSLTEFKEAMHRKNLSWRQMANEQLMPLLQKYMERRDWVSVANIAFMLWENSNCTQKEVISEMGKLFENCKHYRIVVAMKPLVFDDTFPRKPDKDDIIEIVLDKLKNGELDDNFVVVVEAKKET